MKERLWALAVMLDEMAFSKDRLIDEFKLVSLPARSVLAEIHALLHQEEPPPMDTKSFTVLGCARCGQDHSGFIFQKFQNPIADADGTVWDWWGLCPTTGEPVLLKYELPPLPETSR